MNKLFLALALLGCGCEYKEERQVVLETKKPSVSYVKIDMKNSDMKVTRLSCTKFDYGERLGVSYLCDDGAHFDITP